LTGKVNKKRPLGIPRTKWKDTVENYMRLVDGTDGSATLDWTRGRAK